MFNPPHPENWPDKGPILIPYHHSWPDGPDSGPPEWRGGATAPCWLLATWQPALAPRPWSSVVPIDPWAPWHGRVWRENGKKFINNPFISYPFPRSSSCPPQAASVARNSFKSPCTCEQRLKVLKKKNLLESLRRCTHMLKVTSGSSDFISYFTKLCVVFDKVIISIMLHLFSLSLSP